jgi:hypothetical protein
MTSSLLRMWSHNLFLCEWTGANSKTKWYGWLMSLNLIAAKGKFSHGQTHQGNAGKKHNTERTFRLSIPGRSMIS